MKVRVKVGLRANVREGVSDKDALTSLKRVALFHLSLSAQIFASGQQRALNFAIIGFERLSKNGFTKIPSFL